ncbi:MAG: type II toxin-antitoxin system VapC family toxin [Pseudomonadota bacterium]
MTHIVIDTHVWFWAIFETDKLPTHLQTLVSGSTTVSIATVSIYEIGQKVCLNRWPGMDRERLDSLIADADGRFELWPVTPEIAQQASLMDWDHCDPFDRMIAATALALGAPLVSRDATFDGCPGLERVWGE